MVSTQKYYEVGGQFPQSGVMNLPRKLLIKFEENRLETTIRNFPKKVDRYLDIGCSGGRLIFDLKGRYNRAIGIDISSTILKHATKSSQSMGFSRKVVFKKVNIENGLPYGNRTFNAVTAISVVEHLFDPIKIFNEIFRVLKRGGIMLVQVPNIAWFPHRLGLLFGKRPRTSYDPGWEGGHLQYFTFSDLEKLLNRIGFRVIKRDCGGVFHNLRKIYLQVLSADIFLVCKK